VQRISSEVIPKARISQACVDSQDRMNAYRSAD
jgi:hypothetical protein